MIKLMRNPYVHIYLIYRSASDTYAVQSFQLCPFSIIKDLTPGATVL